MVLTVDEVAALLRVDPGAVRRLLESGDLAGLRVASEWRVPEAALTDFLHRGMQKAQQDALARTFTDPRTWAQEIRRMPDNAAQLREQEFEEGTFGAWLQDALRAEDAEREAGNVVPIDRPRGE